MSAPLAHKILALLLAANLLMGLARILLLPPFEGPDETAHYSRIEAAAFAEPGQNNWFLSKDVAAYTQHGPMSDHWIETEAFNAAYRMSFASGQPLKLKEAAAKLHYADYRAFFGDAKRQKEYLHRYREEPAPASFAPSDRENWQYQHPPLYYAAMAALLKFSGDMPLVTRLLVLRAAGYFLAFAGFAIGLLALRRHLAQKGDKDADNIAILGAVYPFFMPAYFVDFARLGNDGLCLFLFGLMFMLMLYFVKDPRNKTTWGLLGVVMGYAFLTKAFMIAIGIGLLSFMALYRAEDKSRRDMAKRALPVTTAGGIAALIGVWPYLPGNGMRGSQEFSAWMSGEGFMNTSGIPWREIMLNLRYMLTSTVYNFTDSAVTGAGIFSITAILMFVAIAGAALWARALPRDPRREEWLPLYALAPLCAGLFMHGVFAAVAYRAAGVTPGYYVHVEAPALALIMGTGFWRWLGSGADRRMAAALFALAGVANALIILGRVTMFTGCIWLTGADDKVNADWGNDACRIGTMYDRLALIAWPGAGFLCFAVSLAALAAGMALYLKQLKKHRT